jgi:molecular chaperone GrpE (heat shock protein)
MNDDKKYEAKIKRLQKKIDDLKDDLLVANAEYEKEWRRNFQKLMKDVVHTDTLEANYDES